MMKRKVIVFISTSLDGYIATGDDSLDWLMGTPGEGDNGYGEFIRRVDTVVMGRRTYEWLLREVGEEHFPYTGKQCYVMTRTREGADRHVRFTQESAVALLDRLNRQEGGDIWLVGGGKLLEAFIANQLVDEWIVTIAPVILGSGIPLFRGGAKTQLKLEGVHIFGQFSQLTYRSLRIDSAQ